MKSKLCIYVCRAFLPEVKQIVEKGGYTDVVIKGFPMDCMGRYLNTAYITGLTNHQLKYYSKVIFIGSSCLVKGKEDNELVKNNLELILFDQCYEILLNPTMVKHFIKERYYIISNSWLNDYKKHIKKWGFDPQSAKSFFAESTTRLLFLDTGLPGNHIENLKQLSSYMGLPYDVLPVGLGYCKLFIDSIIYKWREEKERAGLNDKLAQALSRTADYSLVFNMLLNLGELDDEEMIVKKVFHILNIFFAPYNIKYYPLINNESGKLIVFNKGRKKNIDGLERNFNIELYDKGNVAGKFEIIGVKFPEYIGRYKELSQIIGQISWLAIANARKYMVIKDDKEKIVLQMKILEELNWELTQSRSLIEKTLSERNALITELTETKDRLEVINSEKDKFFSIIAHDLRSPFQGLVGMTKIMSEEVDSFTLSELSAYSGELHKTANSLLMLLQNLLEWAQMQRGRIAFNPVCLKLDRLIKQSIKSIEKSAISKNISITIARGVNINVCADERMIESILRNLISNAVKFSANGGQIRVAAKAIDNSMIEISIKDSGIGISDSLQCKLFKLGEKVGRNGTAGEQSTGLGLLLCKDFIDRHKGKIWVKSKIGKGTTFYFTIPQWIPGSAINTK